MSSGLYDIDTLVDEVVTLPSMPDAVARITEMINEPDCSLSEVGKVVASDPSLAFKMLRLVNSAYYGMQQEVTSVDHAVVLLGAKVIKNLVLSATVFETIGNGAEQFLRHCVACGVAMKTFSMQGPLAEELASPDEAFIYGLIHDIGKVFLEEYMPDELETVECLAREEGLPYRDAELKVIGVDHAALGARLAENWRLSRPIIEAIRGHHDLTLCDASFRPLAATLCIADDLVSLCGLQPYEGRRCPIPEATWEAAELTGPALVAAVNRFFDAYPQVDELMHLGG